MKVQILVEFDVTSFEDDELTESVAKSAASEAAYQNLCLSENGMGVVDSTTVGVDGFGVCVVKIGEDHE